MRLRLRPLPNGKLIRKASGASSGSPGSASSRQGSEKRRISTTTFDARKLRKLRLSFKETGGSVTTGNASSISDGVAALVLVSGEKALRLGLQAIAKVTGYVDAA